MVTLTQLEELIRFAECGTLSCRVQPKSAISRSPP